MRTLEQNPNYKMIAQGNTAEVYQIDESKVLKLFRKEMPITPIENEFNRTQIIQEKLQNIPKALDLVQYQDRIGIIL